MSTIIRAHIINMIGPLGMLCSPAEDWLREHCLPSDSHNVIWGKLLKQAEIKPELRDWILQLLEYCGLEEAEDFFWHYIKVNPPATPEGWREILEHVDAHASADTILEGIQVKYCDWYYDESYERVGKERAYDPKNPWWE